MILNDTTKQKIKTHALNESPNECCGILYVKPNEFEPSYIECENIAEDKLNFFTINPKDYLKASSLGKIVSFCHSHLKNPAFSDFDRLNAENFNLVSLMYCIENDSFHEYSPVGYELPYVNRQYIVGFIDCFSLVKDYYQREKNINITELDHPYRFVDDKKNHPDNDRCHDTLLQHFISNGFIEVENTKDSDLILTRTNCISSPTHASIYKEKNLILHHPYKKPSILEPYREAYKHWTTHILRHKKLL